MAPALAGSAVYAHREGRDETQAVNPQDGLCQGADKLQFGNGGDCDAGNVDAAEGSLNELIADIINIFSVIVGIVAVIMIIYGGFRYITSGIADIFFRNTKYLP